MNTVNETIRVLIADDHPIVRQGLGVSISAQPDMQLVAEATNGEEAVQRARDAKPDVVVMDLKMPIKDGIIATREMLQVLPNSRVIVLTSFPEDDNVMAAIKAGAAGFMLKDSPPDQLIEAIRQVSRGEGALHASVARRLMMELKRPPDAPKTSVPLTPREIEVLKLLAKGMSNREIANELSVSIRTVTTHVGSILEKLNLVNRTRAALYAIEQGLAQKPDDLPSA
jgi:NarL family two-component system response regulator LiaR